VRITDVSPRDGLQNESRLIATERKVALVAALMGAGVDEVEVTSFVSGKWVPQLGDAAGVLAGVAREIATGAVGAGVMLSALVPNERGLDGLLEANARAASVIEGSGWSGPLVAKASVFTAASESFSKKNTNGTIAETIARFVPVITRAHAEGLLVRGYVSCAIACPIEGAVAPVRVAEVAARLIEIGVDEIDLGDTIGAATVESLDALLDEVSRRVAIDGAGEDGGVGVTLHLHDTFGRARACVRSALARGVRSFDGSVAGLGGCPYAGRRGADGVEVRAPGNVATEVVVAEVRAAGRVPGLARGLAGGLAAGRLAGGVNDEALARAAALAREVVAGGAAEGLPRGEQGSV
jgi:hydroxymethylglutaryl-CoA lyase